MLTNNIDVSWRKGILMLDGGETMEAAQKVTHVVLDKTGTLTHGSPWVTNMAINSNWKGTESDLAVLICAVEERSLSVHPLASAIFKKLLPVCMDNWELYQSSGRLENWGEISGRGVKGKVHTSVESWKEVCIGSLEYMKENNVCGLGSAPSGVDEQGSIAFVAVDQTLAAAIILQDTVRHDAKETVDALKKHSIQVSVLTGDTSAEACRVSQELGIPVMASCATPDTKLQHVRRLQSNGHKVMMV